MEFRSLCSPPAFLYAKASPDRFFIPGRIRIKAAGLLQNGRNVPELQSSLEKEEGILSVRFNCRTGNVLVCYDPDLADEERIFRIVGEAEEQAERDCLPGDCLAPSGRDGPGLFRKERGLAARWAAAVLLIGGIASAARFALGRLLAFLLFSCPAFILTARAAAAAHAVRRAGGQRILIRNRAVGLLEKTEAVYLSDSVLALGEGGGDGHGPAPEIYDFVFGIREHGVTDIAVLTKRNSPSAERAVKELGIGRIYYLANAEMEESFRGPSLIAVTKEDSCRKGNSSDHLILQVLSREEKAESGPGRTVSRPPQDSLAAGPQPVLRGNRRPLPESGDRSRLAGNPSRRAGLSELLGRNGFLLPEYRLAADMDQGKNLILSRGERGWRQIINLSVKIWNRR